MKANSMSRRKTKTLIVASRCLRKRRSAIRHWLRSLTVNSRSTGVRGAAPPFSAPVSVTSWTSSMADPRVEHAVQDVGEQIEEDDDRCCDQQPSQHQVEVEVAQGIHEQIPHTVPLE